MKPKHLIKFLMDFKEKFPKIRIDKIKIDYDYCSDDIIIGIKALANKDKTGMGALTCSSKKAILQIDREGILYGILCQPVGFSFGFEWDDDK